MKRPRVVLADDHTIMLDGLKRLLESEFDLAGVAEDGRTLIAVAENVKPDVIVLDISMPLLNGIEAARQLRKTLPQVHLVFLTMHADPTLMAEAFRAGAAAYVLKRSAASELVNAIRDVLNGRTYITPLITRDTVQALLTRLQDTPSPAARLSARQREILQLVVEGNSNKEIAAILHLSVKTVEFHRSAMIRRLGLRSSAELVRYAVQEGVVPIDPARKSG